MATKRQRLLLLWGGATAGVVVVVTALLIGYGGRGDREAAGDAAQGVTSILQRDADPDLASFRFEEVAAASGIGFRHFPDRRRSLLPEDMGSGVAWGDYDDDGDPDLLLVNFAGSILSTTEGLHGAPALYRNDAGRFTDVTAEAGLDRPLFGMAACWGDYDDDGDLDLYLTAYGPNRLYRNEGGGTFTDATAAAGVGDGAFSAGCGWADYDRDGRIDLYVANYVDFRSGDLTQGGTTRQYGAEIPSTINPSSYPPLPNRLYHNDGNGRFSERAAEAGVANPDGRSLGLVWVDLDDDGWVDLYVANDVSANGVYRNLGDGRFEDIGASSLAADYRGAMGLAVTDLGDDGDLDLLVTHWLAQENALFENMFADEVNDREGLQRLFFMDSADILGLGQQSLRMVGWAAGFADLDNDGHRDLWVVNGDTLEVPEDHSRLRPQPLQLFRQRPPDGFFEVTEAACPACARPLVGRGGAQADFDGDGRMDLVVQSFGEGPLLLRNTSTTDHHWVSLRLRQEGGNSHALGARIALRSGGRTQTAQVGAEGSYLSQHQEGLHFGLGAAAGIESLRVRWPDGEEETLTGLAADRVIELRHRARYRE